MLHYNKQHLAVTIFDEYLGLEEVEEFVLLVEFVICETPEIEFSELLFETAVVLKFCWKLDTKYSTPKLKFNGTLLVYQLLEAIAKLVNGLTITFLKSF